MTTDPYTAHLAHLRREHPTVSREWLVRWLLAEFAELGWNEAEPIVINFLLAEKGQDRERQPGNSS